MLLELRELVPKSTTCYGTGDSLMCTIKVWLWKLKSISKCGVISMACPKNMELVKIPILNLQTKMLAKSPPKMCEIMLWYWSYGKSTIFWKRNLKFYSYWPLSQFVPYAKSLLLLAQISHKKLIAWSAKKISMVSSRFISKHKKKNGYRFKISDTLLTGSQDR